MEITKATIPKHITKTVILAFKTIKPAKKLPIQQNTMIDERNITIRQRLKKTFGISAINIT